ncbi:MAG: DUF22 domain-containing protein [Candidatus Thorarchaeota archaeon]
MAEKIYTVSCSVELASIGLDKMRTATEGMEKAKMSLDWSEIEIAPVVAEDRVAFEEGDIKIVPIRPIKVPENSLVFLSFYGVNGMGHLCCIGCMEMKKYTEDRTANLAMFQSRIKSHVSKGDLLGQVVVVPGKKL